MGNEDCGVSEELIPGIAMMEDISTESACVNSGYCYTSGLVDKGNEGGRVVEAAEGKLSVVGT